MNDDLTRLMGRPERYRPRSYSADLAGERLPCERRIPRLDETAGRAYPEPASIWSPKSESRCWSRWQRVIRAAKALPAVCVGACSSPAHRGATGGAFCAKICAGRQSQPVSLRSGCRLGLPIPARTVPPCRSRPLLSTAIRGDTRRSVGARLHRDTQVHVVDRGRRGASMIGRALTPIDAAWPTGVLTSTGPDSVLKHVLHARRAPVVPVRPRHPVLVPPPCDAPGDRLSDAKSSERVPDPRPIAR